MKWSSLSRKTDKNSSKHPTRVRSWLLKLIVCPLVGSLVLSGDVPKWHQKTLALMPTELVTAKVNQIAAKITVKIYSDVFLGSGIIFYQENQQYLVLTNQHVLRAGKSPFQIQTPDGLVYQGEMLTPQDFSQDDLALLSFTSDRKKYKVATIGDYSQLQTGELIFAAGFPADYSHNADWTKALSGFTFTVGEIAVILDKPLQEGYQIGYTNDVQKGMSGGPLLNQEGLLVGINGKHAYPLWDAPDFYEDNSQPCEPLQELITRSSLAIPVSKALNLASAFDIELDNPIDNSLDLAQKGSIFSTIATENIAGESPEVDTISKQHCQ
jgi:S1-C subfamily serine protease